jgi:hypothetical protein
VLAIGALGLGALACAWNRRVSSKELLFALLVLFLGGVIGVSLYVPVYSSRFLVVALPAIYMLVAEALGDGAEQLSVRPALLHFALILPLAASFATRWPAIDPPGREDWRAPAEVVNETPGCAEAPILVAAVPPDNGESAFLYGHYVNASLRVRLIAVDVSKPIDPAIRREVLNSGCAVKFWGAHIEPWQLTYLAEDLSELAPGSRIVWFRRGFLMLSPGQPPSGGKG